MKKRKFFLISIAVLATFALVLSMSLAWFSQQGEDKSQKVSGSYFDMYIVGGLDIRPLFHDETQEIDYIAPGANIAYSEIDTENEIWRQSPIVLYNHSSVETELRIKLDYTHIDLNKNETLVTYSPTQNEDFEIVFTNPLDWEFENGYWYYRPGGDPMPPSDSAYEPGAPELEVELIESIRYSQDLEAGNIYEGEEVEVNIIFEAKQAYYGTWEDINPSENP
ncbi:MAG: hypothetical protein GX345_08885 [Clostridiales bacterium]|nr:hypothetical protein [Clostridiales bacterium]